MREQLEKCLAAIEAAEREIHKQYDPYPNKHGDKVYPHHERPEQVRDANGRFLLADYAIAKAQILIALASLPPEWTPGRIADAWRPWWPIENDEERR